jgi:hypothetical protein
MRLKNTSFTVLVLSEGRTRRPPGPPRTQNSAGILRLQILGVNAKLIQREKWEFT